MISYTRFQQSFNRTEIGSHAYQELAVSISLSSASDSRWSVFPSPSAVPTYTLQWTSIRGLHLRTFHLRTFHHNGFSPQSSCQEGPILFRGRVRMWYQTVTTRG